MKKETLAQFYSCEFCEISTSTFFREHLWTTASERSLLSFAPFGKSCQNYSKVNLSLYFFYQRLCLIFVFRNWSPEVFLRKFFLKICSKFTGEHPCRSATSVDGLIMILYKSLFLKFSSVTVDSSKGLVSISLRSAAIRLG